MVPARATRAADGATDGEADGEAAVGDTEAAAMNAASAMERAIGEREDGIV